MLNKNQDVKVPHIEPAAISKYDNSDRPGGELLVESSGVKPLTAALLCFDSFVLSVNDLTSHTNGLHAKLGATRQLQHIVQFVKKTFSLTRKKKSTPRRHSPCKHSVKTFPLPTDESILRATNIVYHQLTLAC